MKLPNLISLARIPALFLMVFLLAARSAPTAWACFFIFLLSALSDWLDGYLARRFNSVSNFGKLIDALTDKIMVLGLFVALQAMDILPWWTVFFTIMVLCREFLITGLRLVAASRSLVLEAETSGKWKTAAQMTSLGVLLFAHALAPQSAGQYSGFAGFSYVLGLLIFLLAVGLTVQSGFYYVRKYWDIFIQDA